MEHEVMIDGVNYISQKKIDNVIIKKIKEILCNDCGFRDDIVQNIIEKHFQIKKHYGKGSPRPQNAEFEYNSGASKLFKIKRVDRHGCIFHEKGKYSWNMDCVKYIKDNMFDGMTYADVNKICNKLGLNIWIVGRIMYNIEQGVFDSVIQTYENLIYQKQPIPTQNNPQKRRELGLI